MNIDIKLTISYSDLSDECRAKIAELEKMSGCTLDIVYPVLQSTKKTFRSMPDAATDIWQQFYASPEPILCNASAKHSNGENA